MARATIRTPSHRRCECCGRQEVWDADRESWIIDTVEGETAIGEPHCIHEWDINGTFSPYS